MQVVVRQGGVAGTAGVGNRFCCLELDIIRLRKRSQRQILFVLHTICQQRRQIHRVSRMLRGELLGI